jgi:hypothetical protein
MTIVLPNLAASGNGAMSVVLSSKLAVWGAKRLNQRKGNE